MTVRFFSPSGKHESKTPPSMESVSPKATAQVGVYTLVGVYPIAELKNNFRVTEGVEPAP